MISALAAVNPHGLTGSAKTAMPPSVTDHTPCAHSAHGLCWASQESGDLIGTCGQWPFHGCPVKTDGENDGFCALKLTPAGASRTVTNTVRPAVCQTPDGAQVASPQSLILRWSKASLHAGRRQATPSCSRRHSSERPNDFGASAPMACPQKTGASHRLATAGEAAAVFNLNG